MNNEQTNHNSLLSYCLQNFTLWSDDVNIVKISCYLV